MTIGPRGRNSRGGGRVRMKQHQKKIRLQDFRLLVLTGEKTQGTKTKTAEQEKKLPKSSTIKTTNPVKRKIKLHGPNWEDKLQFLH